MGNRLDADTTGLSLRFELPGGGRALFTTRADGNLSTMRGPAHKRGRHERNRLCEQLGLRWLCASRQVHGTAVHRVVELAAPGMLAERGMFAGGECPPPSVAGACLPASVGRGGQALEIDADGHATALRGLGTMVLVADCLPVILGSEGAVAAVHAGWRGLAGGVLEEGVRAVRELGGEGEIAAVVGPGARGCCYEVGEEVHRAFGAAHREGRSNLDLAAVARDRLQGAGVARVEDVGVCTICDERLFSHRREGLDAGRQAGIAWLS